MEETLLAEYKSSLVFCAKTGLNAVTVSKIEKSFQLGEFALLLKLFHMTENRSKICSPAALDSDIFAVFDPFFLGTDGLILLYF